MDPVATPVEPGDIAGFSSLAPHLTGPNGTNETRKAYIVQFAPLGRSGSEATLAKDRPLAGSAATVPNGSLRYYEVASP